MDRFLKANQCLQRALLILVEHCHQPDLTATLDCMGAELEDDLTRRQRDSPGPGNVILAGTMKKVVGLVLPSCFDVSREKLWHGCRNAPRP